MFCRRYKKISRIENNWLSNKQLVKASSIILTLFLFYGLVMTFINAYLKLRSYNIYSVCLEGHKAQMNTLVFNIFSVMLPIATLTLATTFMDFSCYFWLQKTDNHHHEKCHGCVITDIPIRATVISTYLLLPYLLVYLVLSSQLQPVDKYLVAIVGTRINDTLRNPLVATCTFKINDETRQKNAETERERKRQKEIQDALDRRKERQSECIELQEQNANPNA